MPQDLFVLFPSEGESSPAFLRRIQKQEGSGVVILTGFDSRLVRERQELQTFFDGLTPLSSRVIVATRLRVTVAAARSRGIRVVDRAADLKNLLEKHPQFDEATRLFSPHVWQQKLRSHLQTMGLLSLPRLRVWLLIGISVVLFLYVLFWLLPSAEITVVPRQESITQTSNIFLVGSGSSVAIPQRVRTLPLIPLNVNVSHTLTFDQISEEFTGTNAQVAMAIVNESGEPYSLRKGTRLSNQAGMVFRLDEPVNIGPRDEITVRASADDIDLYGEIIGARGNVPAGLRWDFPGLSQAERTNIYAMNRSEATGGETRSRRVLHEEDLTVAQRKLEEELLAMARQLVEEQRTLYNAEQEEGSMEMLNYDELTALSYHDFVLPRQFLGEPVQSIPVEGALSYTAYAYDNQKVLSTLSAELSTHVEDGKRLLPNSMTLHRLVTHVIDYPDDFSWIKLTVDLSGTEEFILDPLSPTGARFAKQVRDLVTGKTRETALRILKNLPEVDSVAISIWPPWNRTLPHIASQISIVAASRSH